MAAGPSTQNAALQGIQWSPLPVINAINALEQKAKTCTGSFDAVLDLFELVGQQLYEAKYDAELQKLEVMVKELMVTNDLMRHHIAALRELRSTYQATGKPFDFESWIETRTAELQEQHAYDPAVDVSKWQAVVRSQAAIEEDEQVDDDVVIEGAGRQLAPNARCPITSTVLLLIKDPVQDSKGIVYERASIEAYLRNGRDGRRICPEAGTSHQVALQDLVPAKRVIQAQKRGRRGGKAAAAEEEEEDVLDVD